MAADPYTVLGVSRTASQDDIRKAYRKLAKQLHPDLHPGDTKAEERFKAVSAAYHLIGDAENRSRFDRGEIDADGVERAPGFAHREYAGAGRGPSAGSWSNREDFASFSDIFSDLFGRRGQGGGMRMEGADSHYRLEVDFIDAARGGRQRISLPGGQTLDVSIPAGITDGGTLRLKGKGAAGLGGGRRGDALVEISIRPHPVYRREGDHILLELPISLDEAVLGAKVTVPTIHGPVAVTVPKGSSSGDVLRLKGRGIKRAGADAGDQRVTLKVVLPKADDPELEAFLRDRRGGDGFDPRADLKRKT